MRDAFGDLHPVINFVYFAGIIGVSVFVIHPVILLISLICGLIYLGTLKGPGRALRFGLGAVVPVAAIAAVANPLFNHYGVTTLAYFPSGNALTLETVVYGLVMACMMLDALIWFDCVSKVMTSDKFVYLFGRILPAFSLILSMTLRFIPEFIRRGRIISSAGRCIGRNGPGAGFIKRMRGGLKNFSILVTWSLENAVLSASSMRSRGYGGRKRTAYSIYTFDRRDALCFACICAALGITIIMSCTGTTAFSCNPRIRISGVPLTPASALTYAAFLIFAIFPSAFDWISAARWNRSRRDARANADSGYRLWEEEN